MLKMTLITDEFTFVCRPDIWNEIYVLDFLFIIPLGISTRILDKNRTEKEKQREISRIFHVLNASTREEETIKHTQK